MQPPLYIDTPRALEQWVAYIHDAKLIAVDTESDSFHRYREKVCLIQMTALGQDAIIDPLALPSLEALGPVLSDPSRVKIFHDACYDLICLHRDYGFTVRGLFDTMLASRLLGYKHFGLAAILLERFGFEANKRLQRSDWAQRPLSEEQVSYARFDTHYLPELAARLTAELQAAGRLVWAHEDFERLPETCEKLGGREPLNDENGFWRVQGVRLLSPLAKGRLRALHSARDAIARRLDRPPFKIFGDWVLLELAKNPPENIEDLRPRPGLRRAGIGKYGPELLAAIAGAEAIKQSPPAGSGRRRRSGRMLDPEARERYEALRVERRRQAETLGLEPEVALGNATLEDLARRPPTAISDLLERPELRGWRGPLLAQGLFDNLQAPPAAAPVPSATRSTETPVPPESSPVSAASPSEEGVSGREEVDV